MIKQSLYDLCGCIEKNEVYGEMVLSYINGIHSVMSNFSLLLYDSIIIEEQYPLLSSKLKQISIEQIDHLYFLCKICYKLGIDPRLWQYKTDYKEYWSPSYNIYTHDIHLLIHTLILNKKKLISSYLKGIEEIKDEHLNNILLYLIQEEQKQIDNIKSPI